MSDIFISYSRKDSAHAEQLAELLVSAGLTCWIDKRGIEAATSWSGEITKAITECMAFVVMLSPNSIASSNVRKEVSLASERQKKILPLDLEPVELPDDLAYHLAGIQRAPMTNIDAVIRALGKLGLAATQAPSIKLVHETDGRKSLMILPFEDLSPTADNAWFADGLATELISALSNVKALRVTDQQTTKEYKKYTGHLTTYAKEMGIRYFIQGSVRKFGDQIKIASALLDIETGDHLWQDSMRGTMNDIFDIQEKVAEKVVRGLNIILPKEEKSKLEEHGTENAEAYEYFMRSEELFDLNTLEGYQQAISLRDLAIELDSHFVDPILGKAKAILSIFDSYKHDPSLLREVELLLKRAQQIKPDDWQVYDNFAILYLAEGRTDDAEREHQMHIAMNDGSAECLNALGYFCFKTYQYAKAFEYYEASLEIDSTPVVILWNALHNAHRSGNSEGFDKWSDLAIVTFQKRLRLHPEDVMTQFRLAATYFMANLLAESLREINLIESLPDLDVVIQYNIAALLVNQKENDHAIESLRKALSKGLKSSRIRNADSAFAPLFGLAAFESLMKEAEAKNG